MARPREITPEERAELIANGYRPIEIWLPDLREQAMRAAAEAEGKRIAFADQEDSVMAWVERAQKDMWDEEDAG